MYLELGDATGFYVFERADYQFECGWQTMPRALPRSGALDEAAPERAIAAARAHGRLDDPRW